MKHRMRHGKVVRAVAAILALLLATTTIMESQAFADVFIASFNVRDGVNATYDPTYGPYNGWIWADNDVYSLNPQRLETWIGAVWGSTQMTNLKNNQTWVAPT